MIMSEDVGLKILVGSKTIPLRNLSVRTASVLSLMPLVLVLPLVFRPMQAVPAKLLAEEEEQVVAEAVVPEGGSRLERSGGALWRSSN